MSVPVTGGTVPRHDQFRAAVEADDTVAMAACLAEDVTFRSPAVHAPYEGRDATMVVLGAVTRVFEDFRYVGSFVAEDGREILEFETRVGDRRVQGIDLLAFDDDGLVTDLTVMLRPLRGVEAVVHAMARELGIADGG